MVRLNLAIGCFATASSIVLGAAGAVDIHLFRRDMCESIFGYKLPAGAKVPPQLGEGVTWEQVYLAANQVVPSMSSFLADALKCFKSRDKSKPSSISEAEGERACKVLEDQLPNIKAALDKAKAAKESRAAARASRSAMLYNKAPTATRTTTTPAYYPVAT